MRATQFTRHSSRRKAFVGLFPGFIILCLLLLSACSGQQTFNETSGTSVATPAIDNTLKNQGDTKLQAFQQWIALIKQSGGETQKYDQQYTTSLQALTNAKTANDYQNALKTLTTQINDIQLPALQAESKSLQQTLKKQVDDWGKTHTYLDTYDNTTYHLGFEYGEEGIGSWIQDDLDTAKTVADYQQAIENEQMYLYNLQQMKKNASDKTPYDKVHQTDIELLKHTNKMNSQVVIVSLSEEAMRIYDHGKLVKAFLVTTGRPSKPTPPGTWWVEGKQAPTVFKSGVKPGNPDYYPDTPINYAMQYHSSGYFIHDSWWRDNYGPGTNFPHADDSGDEFSAQGSHGCVNLSKSDASWVYNFVQIYTSVFIY
ncbi:L,D-transpeptidase [Ktedonospora formicarum]|uniref:L,D-TPase catalytic domain-containing protein n=1 Tax=Ktedonospora formicarum TaxID=2778364 RepID=A0A8J3HSL4_9CHLR|nr:L,D-transpeptidase [Ktedonospora formicarum]GHO42929.1 hypothetical protein KSX_10920 [Ktedonospora formicarum]